MGAGSAPAPPPPAPVSVAAPAPPKLDFTPTYLSQLLPGGIPQASAATVNNVPSVGTTSINPESVLGTMGQGSYDPGSYVKALSGFLMPEFNRQQQALTTQLASQGITGGSTPGAVGDLAQSQTTTLANAVQPFLLQLLGLKQQGATTDVGNNLSAQTTNAGNTLAASNANAGNALQAGEFNANSTNATNQFNIADLIKAAMTDQGYANAATTNLAQTQNTDWLAQLQQAGTLANNGAAGQTQAYQPIYQQPAPVNFGGFGGALAPSPTGGGGTSQQIPDPSLGAAGKAV